MTQTQIEKIFASAYNRANWKEFLNDIMPKVEFLGQPTDVKDINKSIANEAYFLGVIILPSEQNTEIPVYEVSLAKGIVLERNRVGLRNALKSHWENSIGAFIVYHNADNHKWRFTFVSDMDSYNEQGERAEMKAEPKRFTYVLGEGESVRTAVQRFDILSKKGDSITIDGIKDAFSVEMLSNAFFVEYKKQYETFCDYMTKDTIFNGDDKAIRDFNKKLLGRIVFLYFIQKKGWLGVPKTSEWGQGNFNFLADSFAKFNNQDLFYKDFLCPLFFETLNKNRIDKNDIVEFIDEPCRIPYLNGGLFEEDDPMQRNLIIPPKLLENLFDFFNQYNFTIYEDDPSDQTVAVDPEMLGHIFEKMLEDNKEKGAFYTPKLIVHYMCQESLIAYLCSWFEAKGYSFTGNSTIAGKENAKEIDRDIIVKLLKKKLDEKDRTNIARHIDEISSALDDVKICDPAIGSGAFPMGLLQEIFAVKQTLWHFKHGDFKGFSASDVKQKIIQESIYGVDIEKGAVDIARLRFWLSLVVDEDFPKALPNLDYKIVVGNSLVSMLNGDTITIDWKKDAFAGTQTNIHGNNENIDDIFKTIKLLINKQKDFFHTECNKKALAKEIRNLKIDLLIHKLKYMINTDGIKDMPKGTSKKDAEAMKRYMQTKGWENNINYLKDLKKNPDKPLNFFDWGLDFPEVNNEFVSKKVGFDVVIGNPPYIQLSKDAGNLAKQFEKLNYQTFARTGDIYSLFYEKGWQVLRQNGLLCFITSNKWMRAGYGEKTREFFAKNTNPVQLIDFGGYKVFESATVDTNILLFSKSLNQGKTKVCTIEKDFGRHTNLSINMRYAYIRVSTDKQSVENQKYEILNFANEKHWRINHWVEEVISGTRKKTEGKFGKLFKKMKKGDSLIVTEISRLGRNLMEIMSILHDCMERDIFVFTVKERYELGNNINSKVLAFAFGLSAEIERNLISQRTKEALARKKAEGVILGRPKGRKATILKLSDRHDKIVELCEKKVSYSAIGRILGVHRITVANYVKDRIIIA